MVWFKEEKSNVTRMAPLKDCHDGRAHHVELLAAKSDRQKGRELRSRMEVYLGRDGRVEGHSYQKVRADNSGAVRTPENIDFMREEVLKMDPGYVTIWDELEEGLEKQYCNIVAPWNVSYEESNPWIRFWSGSERKGLEIPYHKAPYRL